MMLRCASKATLLVVVIVLCSYCVSSDMDVCVPGSLAVDSNSVEIFDSTEVGDGMTINLECSELSEPKTSVTVEPSLQTIFSTWDNISTIGYYWGYVCEGDNVTLSQNLSATIQDDEFEGDWTSNLRGAHNPRPLPLGATCTFFGCYVYITTTITSTITGDSLVLMFTYYVSNFNTSSCVIDRDECEDGLAGCEQSCVNIMSGTSDSYKCECREGFSLSEDQHNCTDIDECAPEYNSCDQNCILNSDGWYNCSCEDGYTLHHDGHTCNDIDECAMSGGGVLCDSESTGLICTNTPGSYLCSCLDGYQFNEEQNMCTVVDCGDPPELKNGTIVSMSENTSLYSIVMYKCDEGFLPMEEMTRTCLETGNWSIDILICNACTGDECPPSSSSTDNILSNGIIATVVTIIIFLLYL